MMNDTRNAGAPAGERDETLSPQRGTATTLGADRRDEAVAPDFAAPAPEGRPRTGSAAVDSRVTPPGQGPALFSDEERRRLHARWDGLQGTFIDDPRHAVTEADRLVRDTIGSLHDLFERDRVQLEAVWSRGEEVSTEDLRLTLQRYRAFFDRLLSV
ncbi:MAG TPA: hypothetical protein VHQ65_00175 [Thermoanaerobaculia bacterium]|nr:hypothetical protein [Thermoanaerobaculia bacterium]